MSVISDLLEKIIGRGGATYYIKSGETRPTTSTHDLHKGDKLEEADTGYLFVWYGGKWNLKSKGSYTAVKFTVTFDKGTLASAVDPASKEVTYDAAYGDLADTTPTTGYELEGWYFDEELTDEVTATDIVRIEANTTVHAKHVPIVYDITYELDGGTNGDNPATYTVATATITLDDATKESYTFLGWFSDAELTVAVTEIPLGSTGDVTLYAGWEEVVEG